MAVTPDLSHLEYSHAPTQMHHRLRNASYLCSSLPFPGLPSSNIVVPNKYKTCTLRPYMKKMAAQSNLPEIKNEALDLLEKLLCFDPKKRITAIQCAEVGGLLVGMPDKCHKMARVCVG